MVDEKRKRLVNKPSGALKAWAAKGLFSPKRKPSRSGILDTIDDTMPNAPGQWPPTGGDDSIHQNLLSEGTETARQAAGHSRNISQATSDGLAPESKIPDEGQQLFPAPNETRKRSNFSPGDIVWAWHNVQNVDGTAQSRGNSENLLCYSQTNKGNWVHTKRRPFIVLLTYHGIMIALPMRSHGGRGLAGLSKEHPFYNAKIAVKWKDAQIWKALEPLALLWK